MGEPTVGPLDRIQRRHPVLGFPLAVVYKFFDDFGGYLAALITYYGFLSLFPLLLLFSTILGLVLNRVGRKAADGYGAGYYGYYEYDGGLTTADTTRSAKKKRRLRLGR